MTSAAKAPADAQRVVKRCRLHLDKGSPPAWWRSQLERDAKQWEAAAVIVRMQIIAIDAEYGDAASQTRRTR